MLKMYYGMNDEGDGNASVDPTNINGAHFQPDLYLSKLLKVSGMILY